MCVCVCEGGFPICNSISFLLNFIFLVNKMHRFFDFKTSFKIKMREKPHTAFFFLRKKTKNKKNKQTHFMVPFHGWCSTASRLEPLRRGSLLFTTKFPKFLVLILLTLGEWKAESTLEPPHGFEHETPGLGIQCLNH